MQNDMRRMVMGDIHGAYKALAQCLERSGFDYEKDLLIQLGDVADGHPQTYECVDELLKVINLISLKGNHDEWFKEFIETDFHPYYWTYGGKGTLISYLDHAGKTGRYFSSGSGFKTSLVCDDIPLSHQQFFKNQQLYYIDNDNRCFVLGGFKKDIPFHDQKHQNYYWDRSLWKDAMLHKENKTEFSVLTQFREIYLGHTSTTQWDIDKPMKTFNLINMDTGGGQLGRLSIMDIDTGELWQSDPMTKLYPERIRTSAL